MEDVQANREVKVAQSTHPTAMMRPRGIKWEAMPASGDASACMKDLARVMFPSCVGVAPNDAPTREYRAGRICSSHFSNTEAALMSSVVRNLVESIVIAGNATISNL